MPTSRPRTRRVLWPVVCAASVVVVDQATKWLVAREYGRGKADHAKEFGGGLVAIHYVENSGVAFGLLRGQVIVTSILALAVIGVLLRTYRRSGAASVPMAIGCGLVVGGALGNLVDRVRLGYVVDFVAVSVWPKFNVADSAITIGALLLVWCSLVGTATPSAETPPPNTYRLAPLRHDGDL
jgi:signal peptidase II